MRSFIERLAELSHAGAPFVCVTTVEVVGSTPQDVGSKMLVTAAGLDRGTVGGGRVERRAIEYAQEMLAGPTTRPSSELVEWNLQRDVGMTCGGVVRLYFEAYNASDWQIVVFGAGHVANAVCRALLLLDCRIDCYDPRQDWLDRLPADPRLRTHQVDEPAEVVSDLSDDAFVLSMTMGHRTDRPILEAILRQDRTFPYLGVIGSAAKRSVLRRELVAAGIAADRAEAFYCPVGLDLGRNTPGEIAISVAAQLIEQRDRLQAASADR